MTADPSSQHQQTGLLRPLLWGLACFSSQIFAWLIFADGDTFAYRASIALPVAIVVVVITYKFIQSGATALLPVYALMPVLLINPIARAIGDAYFGGSSDVKNAILLTGSAPFLIPFFWKLIEIRRRLKREIRELEES